MRVVPPFRKKVVEMQACQISHLLNDAQNNWAGLPKWVVDGYDKGSILFLLNSISVLTLEGRMIGDRNDWLIQGVEGEIYPCKDSIFRKTYELVEVQ